MLEQILLVLSLLMIGEVFNDGIGSIDLSGCDGNVLTGDDKRPTRWNKKTQKDLSWSDPKDHDQSLVVYNDNISHPSDWHGPDHPKVACYLNSGDNIITYISMTSAGKYPGELTVRQQDQHIFKWTMRGTAGNHKGYQYNIVIKGHRGPIIPGSKPYACCEELVNGDD